MPFKGELDATSRGELDGMTRVGELDSWNRAVELPERPHWLRVEASHEARLHETVDGMDSNRYSLLGIAVSHDIYPKLKKYETRYSIILLLEAEGRTMRAGHPQELSLVSELYFRLSENENEHVEYCEPRQLQRNALFQYPSISQKHNHLGSFSAIVPDSYSDSIPPLL
jgi:hypothetical protein